MLQSFRRAAAVSLLACVMVAGVATSASSASQFIDTTTADFGAGTRSGGTVVTNNSGGEVSLSQGVDTSFDGTTLPPNWSKADNTATAGSSTVSAGNLTIDGQRVGTDNTYVAGVSVEFNATFDDDTANQAVGFSENYDGPRSFAFATTTGGNLYIYALNTNNTVVNPATFGTIDDVARDYRIDWNAETVSFYIKNTSTSAWDFIESKPSALYQPLRFLASDYSSGGSSLVVSSVKVTQHPLPDTSFDGSTLPVNWSDFSNTGSAGTATVSGGSLALNGRRAGSNVATTAGSSLEFNTTFDDDAGYQHVGLTEAFNNANSFAFTTSAGGSLNVYALGSTTTINTATFGAVDDIARDYRIDWNMENVSFYIKNTTSGLWDLIKTETAPHYRALHAVASDYDASGASLVVSSLKVTQQALTDTSFDGSSLPANWSESQNTATPGTFSVSGGELTLNGMRAGTNATYLPGTSIEFNAKFDVNAAYQHVGFAQNYTGTSAFSFSTQAGGNLYAYALNNNTIVDPATFGAVDDIARDYRIDWNVEDVSFYIKNTTTGQWQLVVKKTSALYQSLRAVPSDYDPSGSALKVSSLKVADKRGQFDSQVFDAGSSITWSKLSWDAALSSSTAAGFSVRSGSTATPDAGWTDFTPVTASGNTFSIAGRYFQYRIDLTSANRSAVPVVNSVTVEGG